MFLKALFAFLVFPGIFCGIIPVSLSLYDPWKNAGFMEFGVFCMIMGLMILLTCVKSFYITGKGTLAPWQPPKTLVIVELYQCTRNPMYLGVLIVVGGIALYRGSPVVAVYGVFMSIAFHLRVVLHEERWLAKQFPYEWSEYQAKVSCWLPKFKPYR